MARSLTRFQQTCFDDPEEGSKRDGHCGSDLCAVIQQFDELPMIVRMAALTRIEERRLDRQLVDALVTQTPPYGAHDWPSRLQKRRQSLLPLVGEVLTCVLINLPGVQYTIEIDRQAGKIVHWEWQPN